MLMFFPYIFIIIIITDGEVKWLDIYTMNKCHHGNEWKWDDWEGEREGYLMEMLLYIYIFILMEQIFATTLFILLADI